MAGTMQHYSDGEIVFRRDDPPGAMFVIHSGQVTVLRAEDDTEPTLATLGAGDFFGEMSLFDGKPRSATVKAVGGVTVEAISREQLAAEVSSEAVWRMLVKLSGRMRVVDDQLERFALEASSRREALAAISIRRSLYY